MKNHSELIKRVRDRTLTAKGYKFLWKCIDIAAEVKGSNRYSQDLKETKEKLRTVITDLIIDKGMSIEQIKELIKSRKYLEN